MSVRVMTSVWELQLPDSEKIVLLALADCANDEGLCWPGMPSLVKKCSKTDRTIQAAIKSLCDQGHLTRRETVGKGCNYTVHPRKDFAPEAASPPKPAQQTPERISGTPEAASGKPSRNRKEPLKSRGRVAIPDDWQPVPFSNGTQSRKVVDSWPDGELEAQLEQFKANHRAKGNTFLDPQDAWQTWVLNTRKFGIGKQDSGAKQYVSATGYVYRGNLESVQREAQKRGDNDTYWQVEVDRKRAAQSVGSAIQNIVGRTAHA